MEWNERNSAKGSCYSYPPRGGGGVEEKLLRWKMVSPSTARRVSSRNSSLKCADFNFLEQSTSKKEKVQNFPADLIKSHHET